MFAAQQQTEMSFGGEVNTPKHKEGYCTLDQVADLAKAAGVQDENGHPLQVTMLPFVGNARFDGAPWQLRIESPALHQVNGAPGWACRWSFSMAAGGADQNR